MGRNLFSTITDVVTRPVKEVAKAAKGVVKTVSPIAPLLSLIPGAQPWMMGLSALGAFQEKADADKAQRDAMERASQALGNNPFLESLQGRIGAGDGAAYRTFVENAGINARSAADQYTQALADRGLTGGQSSSLTGGLARIYGGIPTAAGQGMAEYQRGVNQQLLQAAGLQGNLNLSQAQGLGGIGNYYASKSEALGKDLNTMGDVFGPALDQVGSKVTDWYRRQTGMNRTPSYNPGTLAYPDFTGGGGDLVNWPGEDPQRGQNTLATNTSTRRVAPLNVPYRSFRGYK